MVIKQAKDLKSADIHWKLLLYGQSGAGKTHTACRAPNVFHLLCEAQGIQTVKAVNPEAWLPTDEAGNPAAVTVIAGVRDVIRMAISGELAALGIRTIVVDSLTEIQRMMIDEILAARNAALKAAGAPADAKMTLEDWSTLTEKMRGLLRTLRDIPYHVVIIAGVAVDVDESTGERNVHPLFKGKALHNEVAGYCTAVGYLFKRKIVMEGGKEVIRHLTMFEGESRFLVKPSRPLEGVVESDIAAWFDLLGKAGATLPQVDAVPTGPIVPDTIEGPVDERGGRTPDDAADGDGGTTVKPPADPVPLPGPDEPATRAGAKKARGGSRSNKAKKTGGDT